MSTQDMNLGVTKPQDKDAEIAKLKEELAKAQSKQLNDEASAFGRLAKEAELRKQKEAELAETRRKLDELQAKNVRNVLSPEQLEALGDTGMSGVEKIIEAKLAALQPQIAPPLDQTAVISRLDAIEQMQRQSMARQAYTSSLMSWAAQSGMPNLFARLTTGGDLSDKWAAFAQQNPSVNTAWENGDTEATKAFVKLFLYENPGISQQAATPSAAGGFAQSADPNQYSPNAWLSETEALDAQLKTGQITKADWDKGYAEANAKLAALQSQPR
jgi:hypothetical protein